MTALIGIPTERAGKTDQPGQKFPPFVAIPEREPQHFRPDRPAERPRSCRPGSDPRTRDRSPVGAGDSAPNEPWDGDIAEVIVYQSALGASDFAQTENYLLTKYGL